MGEKNEKNAGKPAFFRVHLFCTHYVVEARGTALAYGLGQSRPVRFPAF